MGRSLAFIFSVNLLKTRFSTNSATSPKIFKFKWDSSLASAVLPVRQITRATNAIAVGMPGKSNVSATVDSSASIDEEALPAPQALPGTPTEYLSRSLSLSSKMVDVSSAQVHPAKLLEKEEFDAFNAVFVKLANFLTDSPEFRDMPETNRWLAKVLQYNVPHGKRNRGLATAVAYRYLVDELDDKSIELSYILGWTVEILQAYLLVADDIMDCSETRRGRPCWYKVDNMGPAAINDAFLLLGSIFAILKKYFREKEYYADLLDVMHEANYKTLYGQSLDTRTSLARQMETYTMDRYNGIVKYKAAYYSFHLPVALAMVMAGVKDPELKRQAEIVTLEIGNLFQVQDDYLDCFGDVRVTGKIGTDIQDCKCSWLFVTALEKATPAQRELLLANYGEDDVSKIAIVKNLYIEMGLPELFHKFEDDSHAQITTHIQQMSPALPKQLFVEMMAKIYRRQS